MGKTQYPIVSMFDNIQPKIDLNFPDEDLNGENPSILICIRSKKMVRLT